MALGSENKRTREIFKAKVDWKAQVNTPWEAEQYIKGIEDQMAQDPSGIRLSTVYLDNKIDLLRKYISQCSNVSEPMSFKQWEGRVKKS